jgi:hypothetical protein
LPSRPGGEGASTEGAVEDVDEEVLHPIAMGEEEEPTRMHAIVCEELRPPVAEVALPLAVVVNLDTILGLASAAFLQDGVRHLLTLHRLHKLGRQAEAVLAPSKHRDDKGGSPFGGGVRRWLEHRQHWLKTRRASLQRCRRTWRDGPRGGGRKGG